MTTLHTCHTVIGLVKVHDDGSHTITANADELYEWANRSGARWPCSSLSDLDLLVATFEHNGDLVDLQIAPPEMARYDVPIDEFNAWSDDVREATR